MAYVNAASLLPERKTICMNSVTVVMSGKEKVDVGKFRLKESEFELLLHQICPSGQTEL